MAWWSFRKKRDDLKTDINIILIHRELNDIVNELQHSMGRLDRVMSSIGAQEEITKRDGDPGEDKNGK